MTQRRDASSRASQRRDSLSSDVDGASSATDSQSPTDDDDDDDDDDRSPSSPRQQWRHLQQLEAQALASGGADPEALNSRAVHVIQRVNNKLTGREFGSTEPVTVAAQVQKLIEQATATENLACMYVGWCPFW